VRHALRAATTWGIGTAIFVGLPLMAWGVRDVQGFFGDPARLAYSALALLLNSYAAITIPEVGRTRGAATKVVQRQRLAVFALQVIPLALVVVAPYSDRRHIGALDAPEFVRFIGVVTYALGFLLMHWAEACLGKLFSVQVAVQDGHRLVTDGPYRYVRHPRYLGIVVFLSGIALVFRSWVALVLGAASAAVLLWRIRDEEALMRQEFGAQWSAYAGRSWRLLPFVF
jgi:protein-S-isoprenylcysteine O-methyltransferase Ste14